MDPSICNIGGWNNLQPNKRHPPECLTGENEPWLLFGTPNRDPFFVTQFLEQHSASSDQHMTKLMSLREGLHEIMQCCVRQLFVDHYWLNEHPGGHAPWTEPTMKTFTGGSTTYFVRGPVCRWNIFRRCNLNQVIMYVSHRVSLQMFGESICLGEKLWRARERSLLRKKNES